MTQIEGLFDGFVYPTAKNAFLCEGLGYEDQRGVAKSLGLNLGPPSNKTTAEPLSHLASSNMVIALRIVCECWFVL